MLIAMRKIIMIALTTSICIFCLLFSAAITTFAADQLVVYPDYPSGITQDTDFSVSVTQNSETKALTLYNALRASGTTAGDDYRRFGEFAFSGGSVIVSITVNSWTVNTYEILPTFNGLPSYINGNVITVTLNEPTKFMVKINDDINTVLSIFADSVETDIPSQDDPNVMYYSAGWHDVPDNFLYVPKNTTLYLAPGAVLNSRVTITGSNVNIKGRGMIRDGLWLPEGEGPNRFMISANIGCSNVNIMDIKLIDSKFYNIGIYWRANDTKIDNVKMLSNQVSTDGIVFQGGTYRNRVTNCFIYNADNIFVFTTDLLPSYTTVKDCIVGSTCSVFFPQGNVAENFLFTDINVFRCTGNGDARHGLVNMNYVTTADPQVPSFTIQNIHAEDCDSIGRLFHANHQGGTYVKRFILKNITLPTPNLQYGIQIDSGCGNYELVLDNVRYGNTLLKNNTQAKVKDYGSPKSTFIYQDTSQPATPTPTPTPLPTPTPIVIPAENIAINSNNPYEITGASLARINVAGIFNPETENKMVLVKNVPARYTFYNGAYQFVALVDGGITASDIAVAEGAATRLYYGDVTLNSTVDSTDVNNLKGAVAGNRVAAQYFELIAADVNEDGAMNSTDYNVLKGYIAGNLSALPV